jgi:hypothetical protein
LGARDAFLPTPWRSVRKEFMMPSIFNQSDGLWIGQGRDQVSCDLAGEQVILELKSGTYYGLQDVGYRIWQLLEDQRSLAEICGVLVREYDVSPEQCRQEVSAFLDELVSAGLVEITPASPHGGLHPGEVPQT